MTQEKLIKFGIYPIFFAVPMFPISDEKQATLNDYAT